MASMIWEDEEAFLHSTPLRHSTLLAQNHFLFEWEKINFTKTKQSQIILQCVFTPLCNVTLEILLSSGGIQFFTLYMIRFMKYGRNTRTLSIYCKNKLCYYAGGQGPMQNRSKSSESFQSQSLETSSDQQSQTSISQAIVEAREAQLNQEK